MGRVYHDAASGYGGFASLIFNRTPKDQFRLVTQLRTDYFQIPYDPDGDSFENQQFDSSGLRDAQQETDGVVARPGCTRLARYSVLQVSPFYHYNRADYHAACDDVPVATTSDRGLHLWGAQASVTTARLPANTLRRAFTRSGSMTAMSLARRSTMAAAMRTSSVPDSASGGVVEEYVSDTYKPTSWLTLTAGLRETFFAGQFHEDAN